MEIRHKQGPRDWQNLFGITRFRPYPRVLLLLRRLSRLYCTVLRRQPPPQALRFSQGRGERLVMSRKGPWEGYRRQAKSRPLSPFRLPLRARERRLSTRQIAQRSASHSGKKQDLDLT